MRPRVALGLILLGWVLLSADRNGDWEEVGDFPSSYSCERVRAARIDAETQRAIGSALADQPADNPMRQEAYHRAARRTSDQFRCDRQGD